MDKIGNKDPNTRPVSEGSSRWMFAGGRPALIGIALVIAVFAVYWPVMNYDFVNYDDADYVTSNPEVQAGLTLHGAAWAFQSTFAGNWHPLTWLSLMLDVSLFGSNPGGFHFMNLVIHAVNTVLLFLVLRQLTAMTWRSAVVGALFGLHPLHVESVAWISERKDVLSALFGLLALWTYGQYTMSHAGRKAWYLLTLLFFAFSLMSKSMLVTLPIVMLLLDYWPLRRFAPESGGNAPVLRRLWLEKIPFFILGGLSSVITLEAQKNSGAVVLLASLPIQARLENALVSCGRYLGKMAWPVNLAVIYPHPGYWPWSIVIFSALLIAAISMAAFYFRRKFPFLPVAWLLFLVMLIPVIGLVQAGNQSMADRYTYMPLIGIFIIMVWSAGEILARHPKAGRAAVLLVFLMLSGYAGRTRGQLQYWQNGETLFRHAIKVTRDNAVAYENLAGYLTSKGRTDEAVTNFLVALQIDPDNGAVHNDFGVSLVKVGDLNGATKQFQAAVRCQPGDTAALFNLGVTLAAQSRFEEAVPPLKKVLELKPGFAEGHSNLGYALAGLQRFDEAESQLTEAIRLKPDYAQAHYNLGCVLTQLGKRAEAVTQLNEALQLQPNYDAARQRLTALGASPP